MLGSPGVGDLFVTPAHERASGAFTAENVMVTFRTIHRGRPGMIRNALLTGAAAIALAMPANAGRTGWDIGLEGGIGSIDQTDLPFTEIDGCYEYECEYASKDIFFGGKSSSLSFDDGLAAFLTVGKALGSWRLEGELGYRENDIDRITYGGWYPSKLVVLENGFWSQPGGDLTEVTLMANVVRDFDLGGRWLFSVGAGAGVDFAELTDPWGVSDNDASFAAQGIVGLTYRLSPHWDVMANYRYLWVNDPQFTTELFDGEIDLQKQSFTIGFRYGFDDPAPPVRLAIPPALPATPSQFMI